MKEVANLILGQSVVSGICACVLKMFASVCCLVCCCPLSHTIFRIMVILLAIALEAHAAESAVQCLSVSGRWRCHLYTLILMR